MPRPQRRASWSWSGFDEAVGLEYRGGARWGPRQANRHTVATHDSGVSPIASAAGRGPILSTCFLRFERHLGHIRATAVELLLKSPSDRSAALTLRTGGGF